PLSWKGSPCSPALTRPAAARAISPSTIPASDGRRAFKGAARKLVAENNQRLVLSRRELLYGRQISRRRRARRWRAGAGLPLAFARRRFFALLRRALPAAGHFHLRRTGIRTVARAPDGVPEADASDGGIHDLP